MWGSRPGLAAVVAGCIAVLAASGAQAKPPVSSEPYTVYNCNEGLTTELGEFSASPEHVHWSATLDDGMSLQLGLSIPLKDRAAFATRGFEGWDFNHPIIFFDFDRRFTPVAYRRDGALWLASEVRVGNRVTREWAPINMTHGVNWAMLSDLMQADGDIVVTLYDAKGIVLQRATVPRDRFAAAEEILKRLHARVMEKAADQERLCEPSVVQDVILAG